MSRPEQSGTDLTRVLGEFDAFIAHAMQTLLAMADMARDKGDDVVAERRDQAAKLLAAVKESLTAEFSKLQKTDNSISNSNFRDQYRQVFGRILSDINAQEAGGAPGLSHATVSSD